MRIKTLVISVIILAVPSDYLSQIKFININAYPLQYVIQLKICVFRSNLILIHIHQLQLKLKFANLIKDYLFSIGLNCCGLVYTDM